MNQENENNTIIVIGGGLAGCEAAYQIAKRGVNVKLYEMKPEKFSSAHSNKNLAEIVCSNSFKSNLLTNACGLLKEELRRMDSLLIKIADETSVPAGQALAVDREKFSKKVTETIENNQLIEVIKTEIHSKYENKDYKNENDEIKRIKIKEKNIENSIDIKFKEEKIDEKTEIIGEKKVYFEDLIKDNIVIIATGPLTSDSLSLGIQHLTGEEDLHFYDAAAPILEKESINFDIAFYGDRYEQEKKKDETEEEWHKRIEEYSKKSIVKVQDLNTDIEIDDNCNIKSTSGSYINLPMNKEEYNKFYNELINAETVVLHEFEKREIFEGCMPVEVMAKRGIDTLRFGPLKPVGFDDPRTATRPYAVVQLRQDNENGSLYNIVGFQTNLKFGEQKRVFSLIPGLENAEFEKYGVMHRNTFINSTKLLDSTYNFKKNRNIFFAGQITGVEGYVESISSGFVAGINAAQKFLSQISNEKIFGGEKVEDTFCTFNEETMIGALAKYISTANEKFQPMNANYGILPALDENIKDKKLKYQKLSERALKYVKNVNKKY
jgi:methylenetetrahydrofolate--tRNA-(uracil-5-)-methyltransferase